MARVQLNLKMPAELVARLREEAAAEGVTLTSLAERRLAGGYMPATSQLPDRLPDGLPDGLPDRLAAMEARLAALEALAPQWRGEEPLAGAANQREPVTEPPIEPARTTNRTTSDPLHRNDRTNRTSEPLRGGSRADGLKTTAEVAELLGLGRSALNNWSRGKREGDGRNGWELVRRVVPPAGGPPRWLWRCAESHK